MFAITCGGRGALPSLCENTVLTEMIQGRKFRKPCISILKGPTEQILRGRNRENHTKAQRKKKDHVQ